MFILPILSHRSATAEAHVYIGRHAIIGASHLADDRLIGNRASILSSKALHELGEDGMWAACPPDVWLQLNWIRSSGLVRVPLLRLMSVKGAWSEQVQLLQQRLNLI